MTYEKFPFGKYKGQILSDLPNTYIVHALETFDLPDELVTQLQDTLLENLGINEPNTVSFKKLENLHSDMLSDYALANGYGSEVIDALNDYKERLIDASL